MAGDMKYPNLKDFVDGLHEGEPYFIFRGADQLAPSVIEKYANYCKDQGCPEQHVQDCLDAANAIREWQAEHPHAVKLPD